MGQTAGRRTRRKEARAPLAGFGKRPRQAGRPVPLGWQFRDSPLWDRRPRLSLSGPAAFFRIQLEERWSGALAIVYPIFRGECDATATIVSPLVGSAAVRSWL